MGDQVNSLQYLLVMTPGAVDVASGHRHSPQYWALTPPFKVAVPGGAPPDMSPPDIRDPPGILMWPDRHESAVLSPSLAAIALSKSGNKSLPFSSQTMLLQDGSSNLLL